MSIKIKDLPSAIKQLAIFNQVAQGNKPNEELLLDDLKRDGNFDWEYTKEKYSFWFKIDDGDYSKFYEMYPKSKDKEPNPTIKDLQAENAELKSRLEKCEGKNEKIAIHCPTQELFDKVVAMKPNGKYGDGANWLEFKENTCLNISTEDGLALGYCDIKEFERLGYTIISADDWIKQNTKQPEFEPNELIEVSDNIEFHNARHRIFVKMEGSYFMCLFRDDKDTKTGDLVDWRYARKIANVLPSKFSIKIPKEWGEVFKKWADEKGYNKCNIIFDYPKETYEFNRADCTHFTIAILVRKTLPEITIDFWSECTGLTLPKMKYTLEVNNVTTEITKEQAEQFSFEPKTPRTNIACKTSSHKEQIRIIELLIEKGVQIGNDTKEKYKISEWDYIIFREDELSRAWMLEISYTELSIKDFLAEFGIEWKEQTYAKRQAEWVKENDVKVSSRVKVLRKPKYEEHYELRYEMWTNSTTDNMIGKTFEVSDIYLNGLSINNWTVPYFCLEVVKPLYQLPDENGVMVDIYKEDAAFYYFYPSKYIERTVITRYEDDYHKEGVSKNSNYSPLFATKKAVEKWIAEYIKPKNRADKGFPFWFLSSCFKVERKVDYRTKLDDEFCEIGNYYLTEASAKKASEIQILTARYLDRLQELRGGDYVFKRGANYAHCLYLMDNEIVIGSDSISFDKSPQWYSDKKEHFKQLEKEFNQDELKLIIIGD